MKGTAYSSNWKDGDHNWWRDRIGSTNSDWFVEAGVNVVLCSRKKEACDEVARKLKNLEAGRCPSSVISKIRQMYRKWLTKLTGNSVPLTF